MDNLDCSKQKSEKRDAAFSAARRRRNIESRLVRDLAAYFVLRRADPADELLEDLYALEAAAAKLVQQKSPELPKPNLAGYLAQALSELSFFPGSFDQRPETSNADANCE